MNPSEQSDETDSEQDSGVTRRQVLVGGLIAAGSARGALVTSATTNDDDLNVGGGKMADANLAARVKVYSGPLADRPSAGTAGRYWIVNDSGSSDHGDVYVDDGSTWNLIPIGGGSGTSLTVEDDGSQLVSGADLLDFSGNDFDVTNPTGSEITATIDDSGIDHSQTTGTRTHSGDDLKPNSVQTDSAVIAQELGLPQYDDVANAPQTQGRLVYATGNGTSTEGIYKHDGSSYSQVGGGSSEWQEDGNGNIVPIDGETVGDGTTSADHQSVTTEKQFNTVYPQQYSGSDLGEKINNAIADVGRTDLHINITGQHDVSTVADLTDLERVYFDALGATLILKTTGSAALDFADSRDVRFAATKLVGDSANIPSSGVLMANPEGGGNDSPLGPEESKSERNYFWCGSAIGHFEYAPMFLHGRERTVISGNWQNNNSQGYAAIVTPNNRVNIGGAFETETSPNNGSLGSVSASKTWLSDVSFFSRENTGDGCLYLEGPVLYHVCRAEMRSIGEPMVRCNVSQSGGSNVTLEDCRGRATATGQSASAEFFVLNDEGNDHALSQVRITGGEFDLNGGAGDVPFIDFENRTDINNLEISKDTRIGGSTGIVWNSSGQDNLNGKLYGPGPDSSLVLKGKDNLTPVVVFGDDAAFRDFAVQTDPNGSQNAVGVDGGSNHQIVDNIRVLDAGGRGLSVDGGSGYKISNFQVDAASGREMNISGTDGVVTNGVVKGGLWLGGSATQNVLSSMVVTGTLHTIGTDNWYYGYVGSVSRSGTRNVVNGMSVNSGDPSSTGDWNGNGIEGVTVRDTSNNNTYIYNSGSWSQIASS